MKDTQEMKCGCYYMFESMASGKTCYFENNKEVRWYKKLFARYLSKYVEIHKMYLDTEGFQLLIRVRGKDTIINNYVKDQNKHKRNIDSLLLKEPWRIISERVRIFLSVYAKTVNKNRRREGVLVKKNYKRYYFSSIEELEIYIKDMKKKKIRSQRIKRYRVGRKMRRGVEWGLFRGKKWHESIMNVAFQDLILSELVKKTFRAHFKQNSSPP